MGAPLGWGEMDPGRPVSHLCGLRRNYLQYLAAIPQRIGPTLAHHFAQRLHRVRVRLLSGRQEALCRPRLSDPGRCHDKKFLKTVCLTFTEPSRAHGHIPDADLNELRIRRSADQLRSYWQSGVIANNCLEFLSELS